MFKRFHSEIINKSECVAALMDAESVDYVLYCYKGHLFRFEGGKITTADEADKEYYKGVKRCI